MEPDRETTGKWNDVRLLPGGSGPSITPQGIHQESLTPAAGKLNRQSDGFPWREVAARSIPGGLNRAKIAGSPP
jgi:hypothetical protein